MRLIAACLLLLAPLLGGSLQPRKIVLPQYPWPALVQGKSGSIEVVISTDRNGIPLEVKQLKGDPVFFSTTKKALSRWRFPGRGSAIIHLEFKILSAMEWEHRHDENEFELPNRVTIYGFLPELPKPDVDRYPDPR
jgi:hypothetical protein